ncbi:MAG: hypothetical protein ACRDPF_40870 [Streptosporangiaceae bacterium]
MLIAAAVCPHPPLLVPEVTGAHGPGTPDPAAGELRRLRTTCRDAVAVLLGAAPDLLVVAGGAGETAEYPALAGGSLRDFAVPFTVGADPVLPLSLTIGKWLLASVIPPIPPVTWQGIASGTATADCLSLGEKLAALAPRVALLAMGDGPGCRARGVPGATDPVADRYDSQVTAALAAADPGALAALDPRRDQELFVAGRAAWQVLAGAASAGTFTADLRYAAAPFEVSYYVATWVRAH